MHRTEEKQAMLRRSMNAGVANLIYRLQDAEDDQQDSVHPTRESSREAATIFDRIAMSPKMVLCRNLTRPAILAGLAFGQPGEPSP